MVLRGQHQRKFRGEGRASVERRRSASRKKKKGRVDNATVTYSLAQKLRFLGDVGGDFTTGRSLWIEPGSVRSSRGGGNEKMAVTVAGGPIKVGGCKVVSGVGRP